MHVCNIEKRSHCFLEMFSAPIKKMSLRYFKLENTISQESYLHSLAVLSDDLEDTCSVGVTKDNDSHVLIDKIARWCYLNFVYDNLSKNIKDFDFILRVLLAETFNDRKVDKRLIKRAYEIIDNIMFVTPVKCNGLCKVRHKLMHPIPEDAVISNILALTNEVNFHEMIHAILYEYSQQDIATLYIENDNAIDPHDVTEQTVYDVAMKACDNTRINRHFMI